MVLLTTLTIRINNYWQIKNIWNSHLFGCISILYGQNNIASSMVIIKTDLEKY